MNAQHTPGPWTHTRPLTNTGAIRIDAPTGEVIAWASCQDHQKPNCDRPTAQANARLIAAAPELLAALEAIDKATCNAPLMSLDVQQHFERNKAADAYRVELCGLILSILQIARDAVKAGGAA